MILITFDVNKSYWKSRSNDPLNDLNFKINSKNIVQELGQKTKSMKEIQGQYMGLTYISKNFSQQFRDRLNSLCT